MRGGTLQQWVGRQPVGRPLGWHRHHPNAPLLPASPRTSHMEGRRTDCNRCGVQAAGIDISGWCLQRFYDVLLESVKIGVVDGIFWSDGLERLKSVFENEKLKGRCNSCWLSLQSIGLETQTSKVRIPLIINIKYQTDYRWNCQLLKIKEIEVTSSAIYI